MYAIDAISYYTPAGTLPVGVDIFLNGMALHNQDTSDEQLILAYQESADMQAFNTLYSRYKGPLYRYMQRKIGNRALVDELFQEVWAAVIKSPFQTRENAGFKSYLYRIAHNRLTDHYRRSAVRINYQETYTEADSHVDLNADPAQLVSQGEIGKDMQAALAQLPLAQREVFLLKAEAEMSLQEIAELLDEGFETIKSRYRYAIKQMQQHLSGDAHD